MIGQAGWAYIDAVQFSVGVEYALHSLFHMVGLPRGAVVGIRDLAGLHRLTESYLSKIFTKLRKGGLVRSVPGVNGGYELAKGPEAISFWDVIEAVEGPSHFFQCAEIRQQNVLSDEGTCADASCPCLIKVVIHQAEEQMREALRGKTLRWLVDEVSAGFSTQRKDALVEWFRSTQAR